jgi:hypothetical protein
MVPRSEKGYWVARLPDGEPAKHSLARVIEIDHDEAEESYYEDVADPTYVVLERQKRRYRAMFRRRLCHLAGGRVRLNTLVTPRLVQARPQGPAAQQ